MNKSLRVIHLEEFKNNPSQSTRIGALSQVDIVHVDLDSMDLNKRKLAMEKPVVIRLDEAVRLIPTCSGEKDVFKFINVCYLAINSMDEEYVLLLIKYITK